MGLSLRLQSLLDRCEPGFPLWDLCCDHGQLGLAALKSGLFPQVIFNDSVPHVLELLAPVLRDQENARMICALAENISEPLTGNVVLAGIGGEKICRILQTHAACGRLLARNVVVCPEKDGEWLATQVIPGFTVREHLTITHNHGTRQIFYYEASGRSPSLSPSC